MLKVNISEKIVCLDVVKYIDEQQNLLYSRKRGKCCGSTCGSLGAVYCIFINVCYTK